MPLVWSQIKENNFAVSREYQQAQGINSSNITALTGQNFIDTIYNPLLEALSDLIIVEEQTEKSYLEKMYNKLEPFILPKTKGLLEIYLKDPSNIDYSAVFNLLSEIEQDSTHDFSDYQDFIKLKKQEADLYSSANWDKIIKEAISEAWKENLPIEQIIDKALEIANRHFSSNPKADSETFKQTLKRFAQLFTPSFIEFLGDSDMDPHNLLQTLNKNKTPYLMKKVKQDSKYANMDIDKILHNFAIGKIRGIMGELRREGKGAVFIQTGQIKDKGRNIEADKMRIASFELELDQSMADELEQIPDKTNFEEKIKEKFSNTTYFRIEYSVKSASKNAPKIKDAGSFNSRFEQLKSMGQYLGRSTQVADLIFVLTNSIPGFIADSTSGITPDDLARAVATLGFAFMFDLNEKNVLDTAKGLAAEDIQGGKIHIYEVNNIYYTASDVLKVLRASIEDGKGKYMMITSGSTIRYNGLTADSIFDELKKANIDDEMNRWVMVRNTITGEQPRLNLNYATFGNWNFDKKESQAGLRINFNTMLKQMGKIIHS